jgi:hypothetical protein
VTFERTLDQRVALRQSFGRAPEAAIIQAFPNVSALWFYVLVFPIVLVEQLALCLGCFCDGLQSMKSRTSPNLTLNTDLPHGGAAPGQPAAG